MAGEIIWRILFSFLLIGISVEALVDGTWQEIAKATTIGYKRILLFPAVTATQVRLNINDSKSCPVISNIGIYNDPMILIPPSGS